MTLGDGAVTFGSPDDAMRFFNRLLETSPVDEDWPVAGETHAVLLDALGRHPDARDKMGDGVATFRVSLHPTEGYRSFVATRVDGTAVDFSLRKCVDVAFGVNANAERRNPRAGDPRRSALTARIARAESVAACLDLVARHVDEFDRIHVAAAMHRLARLAQRDNEVKGSSVRKATTFGDDARWRELVRRAGAMCDARELDARAHASIVHSVAAAVDAGAVEMTSAGVYDLLTSLERAAPDALLGRSSSDAASVASDVASDMASDVASGVEVANLTWGFAKIGWQPSRATWEATERLVVRASRRGEMNAVETSNVAWAFATLGWEPMEDTWRALDLSVAACAAEMTPQGVGNSLWAYATSGRLPAEATLRALEAAIARVEPELSIRDQAVAWWSFATLGTVLSDRCASALERATRRLARSMSSIDVCNVAWALSTLSPGLAPSGETLRALAQAERRLAPAMTPSDVAGVMMGYALNDARREALLAQSGDDTWRALEAAAVRCAPAMDAAHLGNVMYCYAACGRRASASAWAVLERAVVAALPVADAASVAHVVYAYARLGVVPGDDATRALDDAAGRTAGSMSARNVANALWSFLALAATRGAPLPRCYGALWRAAGELDTRAMTDVNWCNFFHAYLIHAELIGVSATHAGKKGVHHVDVVLDRPDAAALVDGARHFPPWLAVEAEEAWTRNAFEEVEVSSGHREVAEALTRLGIGHEMECLTDDEYFSLDLYVPEHDCAIEVDGPTHFVDEIVALREREGGDDLVGRVTRRTTATELRDMFLRKRHGRVVTMPWFELDECVSREERAAYVAGKLRAAGIEL